MDEPQFMRGWCHPSDDYYELTGGATPGTMEIPEITVLTTAAAQRLHERRLLITSQHDTHINLTDDCYTCRTILDNKRQARIEAATNQHPDHPEDEHGDRYDENCERCNFYRCPCCGE